MEIWTGAGENAARVVSRVWPWRVYGLVVIAIAAVIVALIVRG